MEHGKVREHAATHFCLVLLNRGNADLDDDFIVEATAGEHMNYKTTIREHLTEVLLPFASAASQAAEDEWREAWETMGADSGYSEYVPTPAEKFNWQEVANMALHIGVGELILLSFLCSTLPYLNRHNFNFTVEWEDEADDHCRTFLLVSPE